jgi:nucleotide-binding universal stress UspA family protein
MGVIVVGVDFDFSEGSKAALRFGLAEAKLRQVTLRAVHARKIGYTGVPGLEGFYPITGFEPDDVHKAAESALEAILAEVDSDGHSKVEVVSVEVEGAPGAVLVAESQDAELQVVGSRGRGGFAGSLLGSGSQQCAHHAACPVDIIPHERES